MALFFVVCAEATLNSNPKDESHVVFVRGANVGVPRLQLFDNWCCKARFLSVGAVLFAPFRASCCGSEKPASRYRRVWLGSVEKPHASRVNGRVSPSRATWVRQTKTTHACCTYMLSPLSSNTEMPPHTRRNDSSSKTPLHDEHQCTLILRFFRDSTHRKRPRTQPQE